ncbi:site-specific DNA-methyltransferase [Massilia sp. YIM B02763]|uniref:site-specific DNA-methyltransferase n=1 Tax=Massilia sp. YIM B02763 TaxID=3050130 RepID=UPI0025B6CD25|nr:site-specific DNA-methyltransferase [Massilia sp. YIM B02763]MDN4052265.1 site-specific DNA-methyltransferase [Massilia sp. YIM B02763]
MKRIELNDVEAQSANIVADNLAQMKLLFPEAFADGKVQFDTLRQLLGGALDDFEEKYGLNWHGKRRARQIALTPSTGTLRPCFEESVDWDTTQNLIIEGDNLEVLKLLQKSYTGKVKLIYIDPPYNTGKDFVYPDNFRDSIGNYLSLTGQTEEGVKTSANTEASGRFHTDWLNMIYPRLWLARSLLRDDGVIFISIDDGEVDNLKKVCGEIFGEENFLGCIIWQKKYAPANDTIDFSPSHDFILAYVKNRATSATGQAVATLNREARSEKTNAAYKNPDNDPRGLWRADNYKCNKTAEERPNLYFSITQPNTGEDIWPAKSAVWRYSKEKHEQNVRENRVWWGMDGKNGTPAYKRFLTDVEGVIAQTIWTWNEVGHNDEAKKEIQSLFPDAPDVFPTPKPTRLIQRLIRLASSEDGDIILDFFGGSGTTADAVMRQVDEDGINRRFILAQLPEPTGRKDFPTIADITAERIRRSAKKIRGKKSAANSDVGFRVFKLDKSSIREWNPDRDDLAKSLLDHHEHIVDGRTEADIVYEVLLKRGLDLCVPMESRIVMGKTVGAVGAGVLMLCLAEKIVADEVEALAEGIVSWHKELAPIGDSTVIFRDSAFVDDVAKTNMTAILAQNGLENVRSL